MRDRRLKPYGEPFAGRYYHVDDWDGLSLSISLDRDDINELAVKSSLRGLSSLHGRIVFMSIDFQEVAQCVRELAGE